MSLMQYYDGDYDFLVGKKNKRKKKKIVLDSRIYICQY